MLVVVKQDWSDIFELAGLSGDVMIPDGGIAGLLCGSGKTCDVIPGGDVLVSTYDVEQPSKDVIATLVDIIDISDNVTGSTKLAVVDFTGLDIDDVISKSCILEDALKLSWAFDVII